ncbi:MAG: hypothetical protein LUE17_18115 [Planctomycetaceae bacterium]|nr:hypothetical protein [Planctomycetaceae bacterium]
MSVGAVSSIGNYAPIPPVPPVGMEEQFGVQASALRNDAVAGAEAAQPQASTFVDPAEAAKFSRDFPQILMQGAFAAPILETQAPAALEEAGETGLNYLWQGDSIRPGGESGEAVSASAELAAPGDDNGDDPLPVSDGEDGDATAIAEENTEQAGETAEADDPAAERNAAGEPMSDEEQAQVQELRDRDREVRVHEQAHQAAGGQYAGGATYQYQQGPDGNRYAIGGEVSIDTSSERTPEATVSKMQQVRTAALAPAEPSSQDRAVAAAQAAEMEARGQIAEQRAAEAGGTDAENRESGEETAEEPSETETSATATEATGNEAAAASATRSGAASASSATADAADAENSGSIGTITAPTEPNAPNTDRPGAGMDAAASRSGLSRFTNHIDDAYRNQYFGVESLIAARQASSAGSESLMTYRPIDIVA